MKVLLVIDMQKGFIKNKDYQKVSNKIESLVSNNVYDKIILTKFINDSTKNSFYEDKIGWRQLKTKEEQEMSINVPTGAKIFVKNGYGLYQKDLKYLKSLNIKEIDICGIKSEACVYAISIQLWDLGIYPNILINYTLGDYDMKSIYKHQFGNIDERE